MTVTLYECRACEIEQLPADKPRDEIFIEGFACAVLFPRVMTDILIKYFCVRHRAMFDRLYRTSAERESHMMQKGGIG